jgi:hypothetical protein
MSQTPFQSMPMTAAHHVRRFPRSGLPPHDRGDEHTRRFCRPVSASAVSLTGVLYAPPAQNGNKHKQNQLIM